MAESTMQEPVHFPPAGQLGESFEPKAYNLISKRNFWELGLNQTKVRTQEVSVTVESS